MSLAALAEDPDLLVEPPEGSRRILTDRYCVVTGPQNRWAGVSRLRLGSSLEQLRPILDDIGPLVSEAGQVLWNIGSSSTPNALPDALRRLGGLRDPDPPMDPICAAMMLTEAPPDVNNVDIRRIETLDEHRAGLEILMAAATWTDSAATEERARAEETFERRSRRGGYQWLAWQGNEPVAYALADRNPAGLFLSGAATLPEARGRGCYRALVHARWNGAVRLGLPGLAVQAQYGTSAPILRKLGFIEVAQVHTLQSRGHSTTDIYLPGPDVVGTRSPNDSTSRHRTRTDR